MNGLTQKEVKVIHMALETFIEGMTAQYLDKRFMVPCLFITYNRLNYTKQALQSLIESDVDEIFIWDNNSTDETYEYLTEIFVDEVKIRFLKGNTQNEGIAPAFNWFLEQTKDYEFICKVDNDTIIPKDFCKSMLPHMNKADIVQAKHHILKETHAKGFDDWVKNMPKDGALRFNTFVGGSGVMMRRSVLAELEETDWLLYSWMAWQKRHPELKKAFAIDVEIELLDTDKNGAKYPDKYKDYYLETKRIIC